MIGFRIAALSFVLALGSSSAAVAAKPTVDAAAVRKGIEDTMRTIEADPQRDDEAIVDELRKLGYSKVQAEKLGAFVPIAFAWPVLERAGVETFPTTYWVKAQDGTKVERPLAGEPYFVAAHDMAKRAVASRWSADISKDRYYAVARRSGEWNAVSDAMKQNISVKGSTLGSPVLLRLTAEEAREQQ